MTEDRNTSRNVIVVIIAFFFLILAALGYFVFKDQINHVGTDRPPQTSNDWIRITDSASLYSIEAPMGWNVSKEISWVEGKSPDWQSETTDELYDKTHIVSGAAVEIYTTNQSTSFASTHIPMAHTLVQSRRIVIDGIEGELTTYREDNPEHKEGLIDEASVHYKDRYFTFRILFNPTTYPQGEEVFMHMLNSVRFEK